MRTTLEEHIWMNTFLHLSLAHLHFGSIWVLLCVWQYQIEHCCYVYWKVGKGWFFSLCCYISNKMKNFESCLGFLMRFTIRTFSKCFPLCSALQAISNCKVIRSSIKFYRLSLNNRNVSFLLNSESLLSFNLSSLAVACAIRKIFQKYTCNVSLKPTEKL